MVFSVAFFAGLAYSLPSVTSAFEENVYCSKRFDCHFDSDNMTYVNTLCVVRTWIFWDDPSREKEDRSGAAVMKANGITELLPYTKKKYLLNMHNALRSSTAAGKIAGLPSAADMMKITWDSDLERLALAWALEAIGGHDMCRSQPQKFPQVGQNVALLGPTPSRIVESTVEDVFTLWLKEIAYLTEIGKTAVDNYKFTPGTENASQILWAATSKMGCSEVAFNRIRESPQGEIQNNWYRFLVCNYGPGIQEGKPMYLKGKSCSKCPQNSLCGNDPGYPTLCSSKEEDFVILTAGKGGSVHQNCLGCAISALMVSVVLDF